MIGSTIIFEKNERRLVEIDLDDLEELTTLDLDVLITLDFEELLEGSGLSWCEDEPIQFDEDGGLAILKINPEALRSVVAINQGLAGEKLDDLQKLKAFVELHGFEHIYELTTF